MCAATQAAAFVMVAAPEGEDIPAIVKSEPVKVATVRRRGSVRIVSLSVTDGPNRQGLKDTLRRRPSVSAR